jgi:hypothetical protein
VQAEIANATCEQIARGGLLAALYPLRGEAQLDCEYARAREMVREANIVTLATCLRAARWLMDAQHTGEAMAVLEHCRREWGVHVTQPPEPQLAAIAARELIR